MTSVTAAFGYNGISATMTRAVSTLTARQNQLQEETATGIVSDTYAGLGTSRTTAIGLQPAITRIDGWSSNVTAAQSTLTTTQTALSGIQDIASTLSTALTTLAGNPTADDVSAAVTSAKNALNSLGSLLNTQSGSSYVFAGRQSETAPVTDASLATSDLATQIGQIVSSSSSAADILSRTLSAAGNTPEGSPFSAALSTDGLSAAALNNSVDVGQSLRLTTGITATQGTSASSTSTGSPIRDLMRNLMVVASLGSVTEGSDSYNSLVSGLISSNSDVTSTLTDMSAGLGVMQNQLTTQSSMLSSMSSALTTQLGNAKNADLASVSTALTQTQTQLQASYTVISDMKGMTLADYI